MSEQQQQDRKGINGAVFTIGATVLAVLGAVMAYFIVKTSGG